MQSPASTIDQPTPPPLPKSSTREQLKELRPIDQMTGREELQWNKMASEPKHRNTIQGELTTSGKWAVQCSENYGAAQLVATLGA